MLPIPGTSSVAHLEENIAAAGIQLSDAEVADLADLADYRLPGRVAGFGGRPAAPSGLPERAAFHASAQERGLPGVLQVVGDHADQPHRRA